LRDPAASGTPRGGAPPAPVSATAGEERLGPLVRGCLWARVVLTTCLCLFVAMLAARASEGELPQAAPRLVHLLLYAYAFSMLTWFSLRARVSRDLLAKLQVGWDLAFTAVWIYCTGGTGSLFIFLYLFVIIEGSILLGLYGAVLIAFLCGLLYWLELHLEYHWALFPKATPIAAPVATEPAGYPLANLIFIFAAMGSAAWLTGTLKQRFSQTNLLLQEKSEKVRDLLRLNESIVRCIRSGLITLDRQGRIMSVNEAASAITDRPRAALLGSKVEDFLGRVPLEELDIQDAASTSPLRWEQAYARQDGKSLTLGCSGAVLRDARGEPFGHLIVFQDLTYFKQMEEALRRKEKLAAIGEMAAGLAHEIRNPLASIYGSIQLLKGESSLGETQERLMGIVLKESERLNGLITDFLLFAFPHAGDRESIPLRDLVEDTLEIFKKGPHFRDGLEVQVRIQPGLFVDANRRQLQQILWNLLLNAAQAISDGGRIQVEAEEARGGGRGCSVLWRVRDNGKGIAVEDLGRVFDPFYTSRPGGTGLGLAIVHRIVENHGGRIHVRSKPGEGTVFEIELPGGVAAAAPQASTGLARAGSESPLRESVASRARSLDPFDGNTSAEPGEGLLAQPGGME
jgi:two-component system sensor histidine kinase PilS (NtrC family)